MFVEQKYNSLFEENNDLLTCLFAMLELRQSGDLLTSFLQIVELRENGDLLT